jgi:crotonobetainyl-CoA:carnitine CoA-transferase CaiB-like acyl-CoA transferase
MHKDIKSVAGPLSGIRVLNIGTSIVGPWAASLLAHLGADSVKVERPDGEFIRLLHPMQKGISTCYTASNNHQRSAELDLKKPEHLDAVRRLGAEADVLIENFRPGVTERIGLGYAELSDTNSGLVYVSSSSWGDVGPMRDLAALDPHVQAFSGFGSLNGPSEGVPEMLRFVHMDPAGSAVVTGLALLGLLQRERFGTASHLKTSHFTMGVAMQMNRAAESLLAGSSVQLLGSASSSSAPNQCFQMLDNEYIAVACETQAQWAGFCRALEVEFLMTDPRFITNVDRVENRAELAAIVGEVISGKPKRWWVVRFEREGVPHGLSLDFEQIRHHQQIVENGMLTTINAPHQGDIIVGDVPWSFSKTVASIDPQVAVPGEHTEQLVQTGFGGSVEPRDRQDLKDREDGSSSPLTGLRVIDATQGFAGPYLGLLLAEAGAEVIKVEPLEGDWARQLAPRVESGNSALFDAFNRNKKCRSLDLDSEEGQAELKSLISGAAVFLEDWTPGLAKARGLDYDSLAGNNPGLVYHALTPFGESGPMRNMPGSELVIQAMTGYLRLLGTLGEPPVRVGSDIVATCGGSVAFIGVLAALYHREKTGQGQRVATSLLSAMMSLRTNQWAALTDPDEWLGDSYCTNETDSPHSGYQTKDRPVYMSPSPQLSQENFLEMLDLLGMREEFSSNAEFDENWWFTFGMGYLARQAKPLWEKYTTRFTADEIITLLEGFPNVWAVEFAELGALMQHPQVVANDLVHHVNGRGYVRAPWRVPWDLPEVYEADPKSA